MADTKKKSRVDAAGIYHVKEDGLEFKHGSGTETSACTPEEFLNDFRENFEIRILERPSPNELILEFINADTSFVNALRRILLSEVPTVAIEDVYVWENSGLIHDEVLAHRLGLVPLQIDARYFLEKGPEDHPTDRNTVVFKLNVGCDKKEAADSANKKGGRRGGGLDAGDEEDDFVNSKDKEMQEAAKRAARKNSKGVDPDIYDASRPYTKHVYSGDLEWDPQGDQADRFKDIRPVHEDILLAKLRPGQAIDAEAHGRRGIGKDHAKFSPVATASYRLTPNVELIEPVYDGLAEELVHLYEPGVFELVPTNPGSEDPEHTRVKARVCNPYACAMSRNYTRNPELKKAIRISREANRFIFSIESVGMYDPAVLVAEAIRVLQHKCHHVMELISQREQNF